MTTTDQWEVYPTETSARRWPGREILRSVLGEVVDAGIAAFEADPTYGTDAEPEEAKRYRRIGPYTDGAGACATGRYVNERYAPHLAGRFDWHSRKITGEEKRSWLVIRFIPARPETAGEGSDRAQ